MKQSLRVRYFGAEALTEYQYRRVLVLAGAFAEDEVGVYDTETPVQRIASSSRRPALAHEEHWVPASCQCDRNIVAEEDSESGT